MADSNMTKNTVDNINNIIRALSLIGILWLIKTTNTNSTNLTIMSIEISHMKSTEKRSSIYGEKLETEIKELNVKLDNHKDKKGH